jgi:hypothetical protein
MTPKRCPFCGEYPEVVTMIDGSTCKIWCDNSKCFIEPQLELEGHEAKDIEAEAIRRWNVRVEV